MIINLHGQDEVEVHTRKEVKSVFKSAIETSGHWCAHCGAVKVEEEITLCRRCGKILQGRKI